MQKQILEHLSLYEGIKKAQLPWDALKYGNSQEVLQVCKKIKDGKIEQTVSQMSKEVVQYLFRDKEFIDKLPIFIKEGISVWNLSTLMSGAGKELLSQYKDASLKVVLLDEVIRNEVRFLYLKYYYKYSLTGQQKEYLNSGLGFLDKYMNVTLDELEEAQRKVFYEPLLSSNLLNDVVFSKEDIQELLNPDLKLLLNKLKEYLPCSYQLGKVQWNQLRQASDSIGKDLLNVLQYIEPEDISHFLVLWLENEALQYDIRKLKKTIPQKSEGERHQMTRTSASYISVIYGSCVEGIPLEGLVKEKEKLLIYAIINRKTHFLALIQKHFDEFLSLSRFSILFDPDVYQYYLNLNTMNEKDFEKCFTLNRIGKEQKEFMINPSYIFSELAILSDLPSVYVQVFHKLQYDRSDDRLRVFREIVKKRCLPMFMNEEEVQSLGNMLSQKSLSQWMQVEFTHIRGICPEDAIQMLSHWEQVKRFVPGVEDGVQGRYLLSNIKMLDNYKDFLELQERVIVFDKFWLDIRQKLQITDDFIEQYKENILRFLYEGGAEVIHAFLLEQPDKKEEIRRILMAELMGRFSELKYHKGDLQKEIDFPVTKTISQIWMENRESSENGIRIWEEDRMLPTMRIGEVPTSTCLSYRDGIHSECLLSCFDSNKKVMQASTDGKIVFRAIVRLTKGCFVHIPEETSDVEFVDLTRQPKEFVKEKRSEELVLFLERPYFRWLSDEKEDAIVTMLCQLLQKKALKLGARLVVSNFYDRYKMKEKGFVLSGYSLYVSASKNGSSYIDSLGGKATVRSSRSYGRSRFWLANLEDKRVNAA